jgi:hypothetical protein
MKSDYSFDLNPGGVPARVYPAHQTDSRKAFSWPTVLFYHGFSSSSEANIKEYRSLSENGFTVIAMDNPGHGRRRHSDFHTRYGPSEIDFKKAFVQDLWASYGELPAVLDSLQKHGAGPRFGVTGISMGGFISFGAALADPRISVVAPILGSPMWEEGNPCSPHLNVNEYPDVAIFSQNGGSDQSVPPDAARLFHMELERRALWKGGSRFVEFDGEGHFFSEAAWMKLWNNVIEWFRENHSA